MTLYEVIHGVAFAQAFNFYMQQRSLIPPGTLDDGFNTRIAFAQDLEAAQEYAHTQANLAWAFYQKVDPAPIYGWDDATDTFHGRSSHPAPAPVAPAGRESGSRPIVPRPPAPPPARQTTVPPAPMNRTGRDPQSMKRTVRVPPVQIPKVIDPREWMNDEAAQDNDGTY
jgi:hypothetical protein